MCTVNNFDFTIINCSDDGDRYLIMVSDKFCTCPKPLFTPLHACEHCWQALYASLENRCDAEVRAFAERSGFKVNFDFVPTNVYPKTEITLAEDIKPVT